MPEPHEILAGLDAIATGWWPLAVFWHACFGVAAFALFAGWRPSERLAGTLAAMPLLSVAIIAWLASNPFNGLIFTTLAVVLSGLAWSASGGGSVSCGRAP